MVLTILEIILWASVISTISFTSGMLFVVCLSLREQKRIEKVNTIPDL